MTATFFTLSKAGARVMLPKRGPKFRRGCGVGVLFRWLPNSRVIGGLGQC